MGAREGAWCAIDTVRHPVLRINGLEDGVVNFTILTEKRESFLGEHDANGDIDLKDWFKSVLDPIFWIRVSATQPSSDLVCIIVPKPRAA